MKEAQSALNVYNDKLLRLEEELGIETDTDDCCANTYEVVQYYDENGEVKRLYS